MPAQEIVLTRIVAVPLIDWQLAESRKTQHALESRKRFRDPEALDDRPPHTKWASVDIRAISGTESHILRMEHAALGDPENEHDGLGHAALAWVGGAPTSGCTPVHRMQIEGAADRLCSTSYLERHFRARLSHVVVETVAERDTVLGDTPFLRDCARVHAKLIAQGCCDWRPDGWVHDYKLADGDFRLFGISVGGVTMARFGDPTSKLQIGDYLYALLVADAYDTTHEAVRSSPALSAWLDRSESDFTYEHEEREAYMAERDALLSLPPPPPPPGASPPALPIADGVTVKLSNFRVVLTSSTQLWNNDGCARQRLGLRTSAAGGVAECVVGAYRLARVLETRATTDGMLKVKVNIEFLEGCDVHY